MRHTGREVDPIDIPTVSIAYQVGERICIGLRSTIPKELQDHLDGIAHKAVAVLVKGPIMITSEYCYVAMRAAKQELIRLKTAGRIYRHNGWQYDPEASVITVDFM